MKLTPQIILLVVGVCNAHPSVVSDVKDNVLSFIQRSIANYKTMADYSENKKYDTGLDRFKNKERDKLDVKQAKEKALVIKKAKDQQIASNVPLQQFANDNGQHSNQRVDIERYRMDPVLNFLSRRNKPINESSVEDSSSMELRDWKDEWREHWIQKKYEAINSSQPIGDSVNMLAARPWGVSCGDPNQHDMPWGSCMLPMECEPEFRIYRGDYFCGRTQFVCCALQVNTYDMYQGFDVSFADSELGTDSEEIRNRNKGHKERSKSKRMRERRRRRRERISRKRQIRRNIQKIIREVKKILNRAYRNGTTARKRKTKQLKKFIKKMKKQFIKDRKSVRDIHQTEVEKIDERLMRKLEQIKGVNQEFMKNQTFRDIVVNGSVSRDTVKVLVETYPDLARMLDMRRSNVGQPNNLDYDIEYGLLYY